MRGGWLDRSDKGAVNFRSHGTLQQIHRNHKPMAATLADQNAFKIG